jgi:hypothetical protein
MNSNWKDSLKYLTEGLHTFEIYSYRLTDGSHIISEVLEDDEFEDIVFMDQPVEIHKDESGRIYLESWIFQNNTEDHFQPVEVYRSQIIAKSDVDEKLKEGYLRYVFLSSLKRQLGDEEFQSIINKIYNYNLDKLDSHEDTFMSAEEFYKRRMKYPDWN